MHLVSIATPVRNLPLLPLPGRWVRKEGARTGLPTGAVSEVPWEARGSVCTQAVPPVALVLGASCSRARLGDWAEEGAARWGCGLRLPLPGRGLEAGGDSLQLLPEPPSPPLCLKEVREGRMRGNRPQERGA